jgi:hypothetical protein
VMINIIIFSPAAYFICFSGTIQTKHMFTWYLQKELIILIRHHFKKTDWKAVYSMTKSYQ